MSNSTEAERESLRAYQLGLERDEARQEIAQLRDALTRETARAYALDCARAEATQEAVAAAEVCAEADRAVRWCARWRRYARAARAILCAAGLRAGSRATAAPDAP